MASEAEVLAAAERLRKVAHINPYPVRIHNEKETADMMEVYQGIPRCTMWSGVHDDERFLGRAYLAHLDAQRKRDEERAEGVTEEWLRSIGFVDDPSGGSRCLCAANGLNRVSYLIVTGQWFVNDRGIFETRLNRGMTEDLLRGLGIEPAKGGGA